MDDKNLHKGHRERLRQKFIDFGTGALCEHELLELALFYPIPRINTNNIAHRLINDFKDINGILNASADELTKSQGIGQTSAEFITLLADVCKEYNNFSEIPSPDIEQNGISNYFREYFLDANSGICLILPINNKSQIKNKISFTQKNMLSNKDEIRRIVDFLIKSNCIKIIVGINHPERPPVPDNLDFATIRFLAEKLSVLNITVDDCIICGKTSTFSLKLNGAFSFEEH